MLGMYSSLGLLFGLLSSCSRSFLGEEAFSIAWGLGLCRGCQKVKMSSSSTGSRSSRSLGCGVARRGVGRRRPGDDDHGTRGYGDLFSFTASTININSDVKTVNRYRLVIILQLAEEGASEQPKKSEEEPEKEEQESEAAAALPLDFLVRAVPARFAVSIVNLLFDFRHGDGRRRTEHESDDFCFCPARGEAERLLCLASADEV